MPNANTRSATRGNVVLVMDVDGVVSPVHGTTDWGDDVVAGIVFGPVHVSPRLCRRLDEITAHPGARGVWLSDWDAEMRAAMAPFPGRSWDSIERSCAPDERHYRGRDTGWWKSAALLTWLDANPRCGTLIWADDHLAHPDDPTLRPEDVDFGAASRADELATILAERGMPAHLIAPDTSIGLTRQQMHCIEDIVHSTTRAHGH